MDATEIGTIIRESSIYVSDVDFVKEPLVSVVIVTYNHQKYIREALDSVLMQKTDFEYEIILSDDCSTDGTTEIVKEYQRLHPKTVKLILSEKSI